MSASSKKKLRREQNAAQLTEKQVQEQNEAKKLKNYTLIFTIAIALVLVASIVTIAITGVGSTGIFERNTKALIVGEHELSAADLNYYYMDVIYRTHGEWSQYYGDYMSLFLQISEGLDLNKPLDKQQYHTEDKTWADHFAEAAVEEAKNMLALYDHAVANNRTLTEEELADVEETIMAMETEATLIRGFNNLPDYLKAMYGRGATVEGFREYLKTLTLVQLYYSENYDAFTYEDADLRKQDSENPSKYSNYNFTYFQVDPSAFILCTASPDDKEHKHTEEELSAALTAAEAAAKSLVASKATNVDQLNKAIKELEQYKDSTAKAVHSEHTAYSNISTTIADWLTEEGRKEGDIAALPHETTTTAEDGTETTKVTSYYVVIFHSVEDNKVNMVDIRHILIPIENAKTDDSGNTVYSEEDKAAALEKINTIKAEYDASEKTEEIFAELAKKNSKDGSASIGGLYENVYPHQMVSAFNDWCFDANRKPGDVEVVETEYGYHLIYFVKTQNVQYRDYLIENELRAVDAEEWFNSVTESKPFTVIDLSRLDLDLIMGTGI